jgi:hypothetical protein
MKKSLKVYLTGALLCATALFVTVACEKDEKAADKPVPAAAGKITGDAANVCPSKTVELSIGAIENATSYQWYSGASKITGATAKSHTVTATGSYAVAGVNENGEGTKSAAFTVTISACTTTPEPGAPAAAGTITGLAANACPADTVELSIGVIENATSYQWYRGIEPITGATATTHVVTQTGDYYVAGVNDALDQGAKSPLHHVTIASCVPATPNTPQGPNGATTNDCALQQGTLQIFTNFINGATSVTWYELKADGSSSTVQSLPVPGSDDPDNGSLHYNVATSGTYAVRGINQWHEGPLSAPVVVTITECQAGTVAPQGTPVILANNEAGTHERSCGTNGGLALQLNIDNLMTTPVANSLPITGALSYTWYIYRAAAPTTPVELETDVLTGSNDYSNIQLTVTEGGSYTIVARNEIGDGVESEKFAINWVLCPPAAPAWTGATTPVDGCNGNTVELQVDKPMFSAPATYTWYKDGILVAAKTDDNRNKHTVSDSEGGVYTVSASKDVEGEGPQNTGRTVTFGTCNSETVAYADFPEFSSPVTFDVYDNTGTNMINGAATQYTVTVKKAMMGSGNPVIITGLGGSNYAAGQLTLYLNESNQELTVDDTGKEYTALSYGSDQWYNGASMVNETPIKATVKKVSGKIYIYIQSSSIPSFAYAIWSDAGGTAESILVATGVDTTPYHGTGNFATVLVQQ